MAGAALPAGCASSSYTKGVLPTDAVDPGSVYLYARFFLEANGHAPEAGDQTVGLLLGCSDGAEYLLRPSTERRVQVIRAKPAICTLTRVVYLDRDGVVVQQQPPSAWVHPAIFEPARAYYLGDFVGTATTRDSDYVFYSEHRTHWAMRPLDENFGLTTREMQRSFPKLAKLPIADLRLAPRRSGVAYTGGLLADEPPLSPERLARLAPFVRSQYATAADCAAACGRGQCLPFRADTGPAMMCVNRCKSDRDCPQHLSCNCPEGERQGCSAIARLPDDAMNGLCLSAAPPPAPSR